MSLELTSISIDGISDQFNDLPRATAFSDIADFNLEKIRGGKFYIMAFDTRFSGEKQILQMNLLHDGSVGYLVPFGRVETTIDLGEFDFVVSGSTGTIRFVPAKFRNNNYALRIFSQQMFINTDTTVSLGSTSVGTGYKLSLLQLVSVQQIQNLFVKLLHSAQLQQPHPNFLFSLKNLVVKKESTE